MVRLSLELAGYFNFGGAVLYNEVAVEPGVSHGRIYCGGGIGGAGVLLLLSECFGEFGGETPGGERFEADEAVEAAGADGTGGGVLVGAEKRSLR